MSFQTPKRSKISSAVLRIKSSTEWKSIEDKKSSIFLITETFVTASKVPMGETAS
jgi:hypothetical protein